MNRNGRGDELYRANVPHRRGDEPKEQRREVWHSMFPTGVGMNRSNSNGFWATPNVPHRRGDEPWAELGRCGSE